MANKLDVKTTSLALGVTSGIVSIACFLILWVWPSSLSLFGKMFHRIDMAKVATPSLTASDAVVGLVVAVVLGLLIGALYAKVYNLFVKK